VKKVVAILLSLIILSGTCKELVTHAKFYINKDFIVNKFCVNLNKPETKCGGKCYLKKSILDNHKEQKTIPNQTKEKKSALDLIPIEKTAFESFEVLALNPKQCLYAIVIYPSSYLKEIFHPPQLNN